MFRVVKSVTCVLALLLSILASVSSTSYAATPVNLIANPSFETANTAGTQPTNWQKNKWGTNTSKFTYVKNDAHTGTKSVKVQTTSYTSGDAKWYFTSVNAKPNQSYDFSNYYKSNVSTEVDIEFTSTTGTKSYIVLAQPAANTSAWQQVTARFTTPADVKSMTVFHVINRVGYLLVDDYSLTETTVTAPATPPTITITSPAADDVVVGGTQTITASATDAVAVAGVQFRVGTTVVGAEDTVSPYTTTLDTTTLTDGTHTITAIARNSANMTTTASRRITVKNTVIVTPPPVPNNTNLIANASVEAQLNNAPSAWLASSWGNTTATFSYPDQGHTGTKSARVDVTNYTNGAANWHYTPVTITANKTYKYENWYKSNAATEVDAEIIMNDGSVQYMYLGAVAASADWAKFTADFTAPANAKSVAIFHILANNGYLITDDYLLTEFTQAQFSRGLVSITFDDGWQSIHTNGLPLLKKYNLVSTQYLNSTPIDGGYSTYMTPQQVKDFSAAGHELGWHTQSHANITTLATTALTDELTIPAAFLQSINQPASAFKHFASPYGAYTTASVNTVSNYYQSHRSTDVGYNSKDNFNIYNIKVQNVTNTTKPADVEAWVTTALANKTWLVLVYHEVSTTAADPTYAVTPANLDLELAIVKNSGATVKTVDQALAELLPQL